MPSIFTGPTRHHCVRAHVKRNLFATRAAPPIAVLSREPTTTFSFNLPNFTHPGRTPIPHALPSPSYHHSLLPQNRKMIIHFQIPPPHHTSYHTNSHPNLNVLSSTTIINPNLFHTPRVPIAPPYYDAHFPISPRDHTTIGAS